MPDPAPQQPQAPTALRAPPAKAKAAAPAGFVRVTLPARYGAVYVKGPDGSEQEFKGGQEALVSVKQAKALGAQAETAPLAGGKGEATAEVVE